MFSARQMSSRVGMGRQGHSLPLMWAYDRGPGLFQKAHVHNKGMGHDWLIPVVKDGYTLLYARGLPLLSGDHIPS